MVSYELKTNEQTEKYLKKLFKECLELRESMLLHRRLKDEKSANEVSTDFEDKIRKLKNFMFHDPEEEG